MADKQHDKNSFGLIAGVAAVSAVAGAFAASMLTPKSGREVRGDIKEKAADARDKAKDTLRRDDEEQ